MTTPARQIFDKAILPVFEESQAAWIERARAVALEIARTRGWVTSDDLHFRCPPPASVDKRVMGAVFAPRETGLVKDGYVNSARKACHGRPIPRWKLPERRL